MNARICDLLDSGRSEERNIASEAILNLEEAVGQLSPIIRHIAVPITVSPYGHSTGSVTWFGAQNPNRPVRAVEIAVASGRTLFVDEKGKFFVAKKCWEADEYHGAKHENYGRGRRYTWHDFPLGQVIGGLLGAFEQARIRREQHLERIRSGEALLRELQSRIAVS
jgi:hypothetical protein